MAQKPETADLFEHFAPLMSRGVSGDRAGLDRRYLLASEGDFEVYYAPFDFVQTQARVVLVGITPGMVQAKNALAEARRQLQAGASHEEAKHRVKSAASFSGPMRTNLIQLLDEIGVNEWLGISSSAELFGSKRDLVHYTSVLRYPVFYRGKNYNGTPSPLKSRFLMGQVEHWFADDLKQLPRAVFVPLGAVPKQVLTSMADDGRIEYSRILDGLPHPSGANAERIAYFLGNKDRERCSAKCNPELLDQAKRRLVDKVAALE